MKKYGLRILVGLIAFAIGIGSVIITEIGQYNSSPIIVKTVNLQDEQLADLQATYPTSPDGKIEIRFRGFGRIENRPIFIFEIINHNTKPATYLGTEETSIYGMFEKFNGKEIGTGGAVYALREIDEFVLKSGESFTEEFFADITTFEFLNKKGSFGFGYSFKIDGNREKQFWSEPITISEEMKKDIIKNAPQFLKLKKETAKEVANSTFR